MTEIDYTALNDQDLKRYVLTHRTDQKAFYAYMDRRHSRPSSTVIEPNDPAWEEKLVAAIEAQIGHSH